MKKLPVHLALIGLLTSVAPFALAQAQGTGALEADSVSIDDASGAIEASGNVELTSGDERLTTQKLVMDRDQETVTIDSLMTLTQSDGLILKAESARLSTELDSGTLQGLNVTVSPQGRMKAARAAHSPDNLTLDDAIFTACDECADPQDAPLWQIQASEIDYDRVGQNVIYKHPRLEVYGVPVFYLPYMAHAGPEIDKRSGFLAPRIVSNGDFGGAVETPYLFDLAPNYDVTIAPRVSEFQDPSAIIDWRHLTRFGSYEMNAQIHNPSNELTADTERETRWGLTGAGRFQLAEWQLDFAVQDASDDLFFKRYDRLNTNRLTNRLSLTRDWANQNLRIEAYKFRNTLSAETGATVDMILPSLTHQYFFAQDILGGSLTLSNQLTHDARRKGTDVTHAASQLDWDWQHTTQGGFVLTASNRLALDAYQYDPLEGQTIEAEEFLMANATALSIAYPLRRIGTHDKQTIAPQAQIVLATENEDYDDVPFINGASISLSRAQLFNPLATKDEASRVNLGVTHSLELLSHLQTELFVGQSFNLSDRTYATNSGYGEDRSALLVDIAAQSGPLKLARQTRLDSTSHEELRSETNLQLAFERLQLGYAHSFYAAGQNGSAPLEEATGSVDWRINRYWSLTASTRDNLETDMAVESRAVLNYEDECTLLQVSIERDYSRIINTGIEPDTSINFTFTLKTIGGVTAR